LLQPLWDECGDTLPDRPDRDTAAYRQAIAAIAKRFKTQDETPLQNPHCVRSFEMHRLPILNRWYWLFAPGHQLVVQAYLHSLDYLTDSSVEPHRRFDHLPDHPPNDHPVIYISWYDAWAFCQWTNWRSGDKRFGLRLPHEPEWEYAARWTCSPNGPVRSDHAWRWWWGNDFYRDEDSLMPETPVDGRAHVDGRPGQTRAPEHATPNGLGFHDILGNVWEWTASLYNEASEDDLQAVTDSALGYSRLRPVAPPPVNGQRTMRGGLWYYLNILATCTNRFRYECNDRDSRVGFRVVREECPPDPGNRRRARQVR
jgi:formylglycine-generating enzyme required for sulfatase activity